MRVSRRGRAVGSTRGLGILLRLVLPAAQAHRHEDADTIRRQTGFLPRTAAAVCLQHVDRELPNSLRGGNPVPLTQLTYQSLPENGNLPLQVDDSARFGRGGKSPLDLP